MLTCVKEGGLVMVRGPSIKMRELFQPTLTVVLAEWPSIVMPPRGTTSTATVTVPVPVLIIPEGSDQAITAGANPKIAVPTFVSGLNVARTERLPLSAESSTTID